MPDLGWEVGVRAVRVVAGDEGGQRAAEAVEVFGAAGGDVVFQGEDTVT